MSHLQQEKKMNTYKFKVNDKVEVINHKVPKRVGSPIAIVTKIISEKSVIVKAKDNFEYCFPVSDLIKVAQ